MDQRQHMKLPNDRSEDVTPSNSRLSSTAGSKPTIASLPYTYPHVYAVELRNPLWLREMIASAEACFQFDADSSRKETVITQGYYMASLDVDFPNKVAAAAAKSMIEWVNAQSGAANSPTALFRYVPATALLHPAPLQYTSRGRDASLLLTVTSCQIFSYTALAASDKLKGIMVSCLSSN